MGSVEDFMISNGISFILHEHPPVFTCYEADIQCNHIPGLACKNLFLTNQSKDHFYLVIVSATVKANLKHLSVIVKEKRLLFADPSLLLSILGLEKGSVTPFGLINDCNNTVKLLISKKVINSNIVKFHPNRNSATLELTNEMFKRYLKILENEIIIFDEEIESNSA